MAVARNRPRDGQLLIRRFCKLAGSNASLPPPRSTGSAKKSASLPNVIDPRDLRMRCERKGDQLRTDSLRSVIVSRMLMPVADPTRPSATTWIWGNSLTSTLPSSFFWPPGIDTLPRGIRKASAVRITRLLTWIPASPPPRGLKFFRVDSSTRRSSTNVHRTDRFRCPGQHNVQLGSGSQGTASFAHPH